MSELIKREDAINAVEMFFKDAYIEDADVHCTDMVYEINHIPAAPRWRRCEVDMPTKAGWYLVMDVDGDFNVDEWHNTFGWQFITPFDADRITHWMYIEPPTETERSET